MGRIGKFRIDLSYNDSFPLPTPIPHTYEEEDLLKHLLTQQTVMQGLWSFQLILKNKEKSNQHFMLTALNPEYRHRH